MTEHASPQGGGRTYTRHGAELTPLASAVALLGLAWTPEWITTLDAGTQQVARALLIGAITGGISTAYRWLHVSGIEGALVARIKRALGATAVLALALIAGGGCAIVHASVEPVSFTGIHGETIVACRVKGQVIVFGDASVCRTVDGGKASGNATRIVTGTVEAAGRIVAGLAGGLGAGLSSIGSSIPAPVVPPAPVEAQPDAGYLANDAPSSPSSSSGAPTVRPDGTVVLPDPW